MKKGYRVYQNYLKGQRAISLAKDLFDSTDKDKWLTVEDKRNRREAIIEEAEKAIKEAKEEMLNRALDEHAETYVIFNRQTKAHDKDLATKAAIIGPQLAEMSDEQLLKMLDTRFDDKLERTLISNYIQARIDSRIKKETGTSTLESVPDPLTQKYNNVFWSNVDRMSGTDAAFLEDLRAAQKQQNFAHNAATALELDLKGLKGELASTSPDLIRRRDAKDAVDNYIGSGHFDDK